MKHYPNLEITRKTSLRKQRTGKNHVEQEIFPVIYRSLAPTYVIILSLCQKATIIFSSISGLTEDKHCTLRQVLTRLH